MATPPWIRRTAGVLLGTALTVGSPVTLAEIGDVLETPARETKLADENLLTDLERAGDRLVAVGERGHIIYSDDQGETWRQAEVPVQVTLTGVDFPNATKGWAVGHGGVILHSPDGGESWEKQLDGWEAVEKLAASLEEKIARMKEQIEEAPEEEKADLEWDMEGVQITLENLKADQALGPWKPFLDVAFQNATTGFAIGAYGFVFRTTDGGETWQDWSSNVPNPDGFHLNGLAELTGGALLMVGEAGTMYRSTDEGESWESVQSPYTGSWFHVIATGNVNEAIAFGLRGNTFRTTDMGRSWTAVTDTSDSTLNNGVVNGDGRITLVGNGGAVLVSTNDGESFRPIFRDDREGVLDAEPVSDTEMLLIGEGGVKRTDLKGRNL
ncbi:photosystem I reaction center subunit IV [Tamilnaduibacter salinus]|uniref:Photosystem I reaction center subunit IV n=1 Tax=Tamilnaduibacter salinus TaxID=1484056 RepID=A0A2A2I5U8_9GAMM|nr:YCF48-related protein [Tamilnaduibacter salinus]PAV26500.1 photosystem I reaction center subunit IV [Tamilnaduibacter salinus]